MEVLSTGGVGQNRRFLTNILLEKQWKIGTVEAIGTRMHSIKMAIFPVTLSDLTTPNHPIFYILHHLSYLHNQWRFFKFGS